MRAGGQVFQALSLGTARRKGAQQPGKATARGPRLLSPGGRGVVTLKMGRAYPLSAPDQQVTLGETLSQSLVSSCCPVPVPGEGQTF